MITKKFLRNFVLFALISALAFIASCSQPTDNDGGSPGNQGGEENPGEYAGEDGEEPGEEVPDVRAVMETLPDADYRGYEFRIWTSNHFNSTLEGRQAPEEEQTGDLVNDALYLRDRLVEEKYNIEIVYNIYDDSGPLFSAAQRTINAGDDSFDYALDKMMDSKSLAQSGLLVDFSRMPNIDLSNEWWSKYALRDLTIDGRFFFPTGDITARYAGSQYLMLFNKKLFEDFGLDLPYREVLEGNWTLDALFDLTKHGTQDLNGDGELRKTDDRFGLVVENMAPFCFLHASGEGLTKIVDGNPVFNVRNDRTVDVMEKLSSVWNDPYYVYLPTSYNTYDEVPIFKEDRALFAAMTGTNTVLFKDMESDFGIVPLPKFDGNQTDYYSYCQPYGSAAVCVPVTATDLERTGMIIEAMAAGGKYMVTPEVYDVTFKIKYARDEESSQMLDIILDGSVYDFAFIYDWGQVYSSFCTTIARGDSFLTRFDAIEDRAQSGMERTIEAFTNTD
ncbi:MAG: extracellular solute-binding protein [Oscillospiraceae bacterium]|nr:extracellular solute-binding protein [Oscillospiraceae bacterium]